MCPGFTIVDEYVTCDALGMSQEYPTIVVTPVAWEKFVGGAGIVALHARGLGADVQFFSVAGKDEIQNYAQQRLESQGVHVHLFQDESRPTTLKQRFRARQKTLHYEQLIKVFELEGFKIQSNLIYSKYPSALSHLLISWKVFRYRHEFLNVHPELKSETGGQRQFRTIRRLLVVYIF